MLLPGTQTPSKEPLGAGDAHAYLNRLPDMVELQNKCWKIICPENKFNKLRREEKFWALLTLARIVNSLHFCQIPALDAQNEDTPSSKRQLTNSFLFACSVLYEGLKVADTLGRYFKELPSFQCGFAALLKDPKTKKLRNTLLKKLRNKSVFHFDSEVAEKGLKNLNLPHYTFVSGYGTSTKEIYFDLADNSFISFLLSEQYPDSDPKKVWQEFVVVITDLMGKFSKSAQTLIEDVLFETGWRLETNRHLVSSETI